MKLRLRGGSAFERSLECGAVTAASGTMKEMKKRDINKAINV